MGFRRRPFRLAVLLAGACLTAACVPAPDGPSPGVRSAARKAIVLAHQRAPEKARHLEWLLREAERIDAAERAAVPWERVAGRSAAAWQRLTLSTWETVVNLQRHERDLAAQWEAARGPLLEELRVGRAKLRDGAGLGRREVMALKRAEFHIDLGGRLAASGDHQRALVAAGQAQDFLAVVHHGWDSLHERFQDPRLLRQWREWARETIAQSRRSADTAIIVDKLRRRLALYHRGVQVASFPAELGANGLRPKNHAGDQATPEGMYRVLELKEGGNTKYYKALLIDYPNGDDLQRFRRAKQRGTIPSRVAIGGLIEIHGAGGEGKDWTDGCVALTNSHIDDLYGHVRVGTPVTIVGTL